ncbi:hypothetical protein J4209_00735 [Candidatus Woesearchaeota archaeon]|nr:hypothetical protein [Candidatus Woesearchaeota archaeon]
MLYRFAFWKSLYSFSSSSSRWGAEWGKFTQPDTLIQNVYDPQQLNRYSFERNNPYKFIDPDGREVTYFHPVSTYNALRDLGFSRIESVDMAWYADDQLCKISFPYY